MLYQLPDGRTIYLTIEEYLSLTDEGLRDLMGSNLGTVVNNPMFRSATLKPGRPEPEEDTIKEIPDVSSEEKRKDQDYTAENE